MGLFSSSETKITQAPEPAEVGESRRFQADLLRAGTPDIPTRGIADLSDLERIGISLATDFANAGLSPERQISIDEAVKLATASTDISGQADVQAILKTVLDEGNLIANRVGRGLQLTGNATSTTGRDVLGRTVADIEANALTALSPLLESARNRKLSAVSLLDSITRGGEASELNRINVATGVGALPRGIEQARETATFEQRLREALFPTQNLGPIAAQLSQNKPDLVVSGGDPSIFSQVAGPAAQLGSAAILASAISDRRVKENIRPIAGAMEKVMKLAGYTYNYKTDAPENRRAGVMAQDLEEVLPEGVRMIDGVRFVEFDGLGALMIEAMKEVIEMVRSN